MPSIKNAIADAFSRSAHRYDGAANVQQLAGHHLLEMMQGVVHKKRPVIADMGCGTGFFIPALIEAFHPKQYVGIDIAEGMLAVAQDNSEDLLLGKSVVAQWACQDVENLTLPDQSVDIIFANFSLQWCDDLSTLLQGFYRVLASGGSVCFTSLGEQTLHELRQSWQRVDNAIHVNQFASVNVWQKAIEQTPFSIEQRQSREVIDYFGSPKQVMESLKAIGANRVKGEPRVGLTGKQRFSQVITEYESYRTANGIPATYAVDSWVLRKPSNHH